jgi:hypothetical protein
VRIIAGEDGGFSPQGGRHHNRIRDVRRFSCAKQPSRLVRLGLAERNDGAPGQEAPKLRLLRGPAHLSDHRRGNQWNKAKFQTDLVFGPRTALVAVPRAQHLLPSCYRGALRTVRNRPSIRTFVAEATA